MSNLRGFRHSSLLTTPASPSLLKDSRFSSLSNLSEISQFSGVVCLYLADQQRLI
jgi:hypothetical protein